MEHLLGAKCRKRSHAFFYKLDNFFNSVLEYIVTKYNSLVAWYTDKV